MNEKREENKEENDTNKIEEGEEEEEDRTKRTREELGGCGQWLHAGHVMSAITTHPHKPSIMTGKVNNKTEGQNN
ncbi:hypothetical protein PoB_001924200 [Plakobranchus ocellatus]|uniref:Uncharacterized protein n=1 Tax=Plakobranchus ocellatus TaxID=259542 RepID=A0AAV3ZDY3_9GAST|nr:hypothetical protein PoB_001924200 [Plakobranchus ocellatus]